MKTKRMVAAIGLMLFSGQWTTAAAPIAEEGAVRKPPPLCAPVRINVAEAIIEPFWDPMRSGLPYWEIADGAAHGLQVRQTWASVDFQWAAKPVQGPALSMARAFDMDCRGFDRLIIAATLPARSVLRVIATTDAGERAYASGPVPEIFQEHALELQGAERIHALSMDVTPAEDGPAAGWFVWIGLQNMALLPAYEAAWDFSQFCWDAHLRDVSFQPQFQPVYGIFLSPEELSAMRAEHEQALRDTGESPFLQAAESLRSLQPEQSIHQFVWSSGRTNQTFGRIRDADRPRHRGGAQAARLGLVLRDADLLRLAARSALSSAVSEKWDDGFPANFPGSAWELRSFRRSYCTEEIAVILDLAGEMFSELGREYLMRRMAEEGIGPVNYITWKFDYLFHGNQMAFVTKGRMYACLVMERVWPRVKPHTEIAYRDLYDTLANVIMPDGGFLEPPSYFGATIGNTAEILHHYARTRDKTLKEALPDVLRRTADYGAVVASTLPDADVIPFGDSGPTMRTTALLVLASVNPESVWTAIFRKHLARLEGARFSPMEQALLATIPETGPPLPSFVILPETGLAASLRAYPGGDAWVKLLVIGNRGADPHDHEHEDRGSFVLEFAGEVFALDPGIAEYSDPIHGLMKQCQYHNMLVPVGVSGRPRPTQPITADITPEGAGDAETFRLRMDLTPGWEAYYRRWARTWESPAPDQLTIRDEFDLAQGDGVDHYWITRLPCVIENDQVRITGARGRVTLDVPADATARIDILPGPEGAPYNRIAFHRRAPAGTLELRARLSLRQGI